VKDKLLHTPEGVRDIYGKEYRAKLFVEEQLMAKMKLYGFESIETPTFEYFDIFSEERGYFLGFHSCDVKNEVIVASIVSRSVGDGLDECVTFAVDTVHEFFGFFWREIA
jgi:hypothetical protein